MAVILKVIVEIHEYPMSVAQCAKKPVKVCDGKKLHIPPFIVLCLPIWDKILLDRNGRLSNGGFHYPRNWKKSGMWNRRTFKHFL